MILHRCYVICDLCQAAIREDSNDALRAHAKADAKGWRIVALHYSGLTAEFCPKCAAGKTDAELCAKQLERKENAAT